MLCRVTHRKAKIMPYYHIFANIFANELFTTKKYGSKQIVLNSRLRGEFMLIVYAASTSNAYPDHENRDGDIPGSPIDLADSPGSPHNPSF